MLLLCCCAANFSAAVTLGDAGSGLAAAPPTAVGTHHNGQQRPQHYCLKFMKHRYESVVGAGHGAAGIHEKQQQQKMKQQ
jgi:hypothetical protein